jgi:hypothetical protein
MLPCSLAEKTLFFLENDLCDFPKRVHPPHVVARRALIIWTVHKQDLTALGDPRSVRKLVFYEPAQAKL